MDVLYWVGCAAAFDDRNRRVARAVVTCLHAAGVRFAVLGHEETCSGDPARRLGNEYLYQVLARANVETLDRYRPPAIITACPHCFNTLSNEYRQFGGRYEVLHHSVYLARLVAGGRLRTDTGSGQPVARTVTYHDACYLARYNDVLAEPAAVLRAVPGIQLREMDRRGREGFCCGAGGGRMWMEERRGIRINAERTRQALETGADTVATACPFCLVMMHDGIADAEGANPIRDAVESMDIAELLAASLAAGSTSPAVRSSRQADPHERPADSRAGGVAGRRPRFARHRIAPRAADIDPLRRLPARYRGAARAPGRLRTDLPDGVRWTRRDPPDRVPMIEEVSHACATSGPTPRRPGAGLAAAAVGRERRAEAALDTGAGERPSARRVCPYRGRRGVGLGRHPDARGARRRRMAHRRHETVHQSRQRGRPDRRLRRHGSGSREAP